MSSLAPQRNGSLLTSWKEIATYMGRSVRSVQRLEKFGLPVRRLSSSSKSSVMADSRDIDLWLGGARAHGFANPQSCEQIFLRGSLAEAIKMSRVLRTEMALLREERHQDIVMLRRTLEKLIETMNPKETPLAEPRQATSKYKN